MVVYMFDTVNNQLYKESDAGGGHSNWWESSTFKT